MKNLLSKAVVVLVLGLSAPVMAQSITDEAAAVIAKDRRQQQVYEASSLIQEKLRLEKRLAEITDRLSALDNNADPKRGEGIMWSVGSSTATATISYCR